ncbi:MAG: aminotransferase class IV [Ghiorsea sp.]
MDKPLLAYVNDAFVPLDEACVHIEDRGFQFADGVYEVVACFNGNYLDLELHLERLKCSCDAITIDLPKTMSELESLVQEAYAKNPFQDAMVYIQVTRGVAPRAHAVLQKLTPTFIITVREFPKPSHEKLEVGLKAITMSDIRWKHCEIKSIALLASVMGKQEALCQQVDETFWLDTNNHVLEGCATNVFAVIKGVLVTHPLDHQVLGGITRKMVLKAAKDLAIDVEQREWLLNECGLNECMISSTTNAVMPVCMINNQAVGDGKPGRVSLQLREHLLEQLQVLRDA